MLQLKNGPAIKSSSKEVMELKVIITDIPALRWVIRGIWKLRPVEAECPMGGKNSLKCLLRKLMDRVQFGFYM